MQHEDRTESWPFCRFLLGNHNDISSWIWVVKFSSMYILYTVHTSDIYIDPSRLNAVISPYDTAEMSRVPLVKPTSLQFHKTKIHSHTALDFCRSNTTFQSNRFVLLLLVHTFVIDKQE